MTAATRHQASTHTACPRRNDGLTCLGRMHDAAPTTYEEQPWWQQQGPTVLSSFPADTDH